ncbi:uncharacterized protein JN550_008162 [Neoarthrinium moseri]|uniref:uncharacterized protein n=1 Tax=Neoarthrinium moseri TaxID=1658444 RepID=UPI001FDAE46E|nr:uncharacterized protein JN550_008162 [Neoarthrinium moseri]KAI1865904.1 hypothetical protein JN550_008162 [Neoarthrinium moseri]
MVHQPKPFWSRTFSYAHPAWTRTMGRESGASDIIKPDLNSMLPHTKEAGFDIYSNTEDAYAENVPAEDEWFVEDTKNRYPYMQHVKELSGAWPHLRYLAQWMEVTTSPVKWKQFKQLGPRKDFYRNERAARTKVAVVDFSPDGTVEVLPTIERSSNLCETLQEGQPSGVNRLYIVEDLSRDMIEHLGKELDIDPLFFREQINDYWWYNTRDPWVELPDLDVVARERSFFRLTYVQPRYFKEKDSFLKAKLQAGKFNVLRRLDDDSEHKALFDNDNAIVALVRSKASLWIKPRMNDEEGNFTGVLLVDPSITEGHALWNGYRPFWNSPSYSDRRDGYPKRQKETLFDDLLFWIRHMSPQDVVSINTNPKAMMYRMTQVICSDWLLLNRYIMARLGQIEWELERADLRPDANSIDASLAKLHTWRRRLPLYRNMVDDTQHKLFDDIKDGHVDCISKMQKDFEIVSKGFDDLYGRTERIATVATAVTAIEENRRAVDQNRAVTRLTYLAVIFAPLSFISSFFSMTEDLSSLTNTIWIYFSVAIPVSIVAFLLVDPTVLSLLGGLLPGKRDKKKKM